MPNDAIGGYALLDDGAPFPGGDAFRTTRPGTDAPAFLKRYRAEWFAPADSMDGFHSKARAVLGLSHPNLLSLFDAGFVGSNVFAVQEAFESANLEMLVKEMGAMPGTLAADFARQAALGMQAAHDRGLVHGDVRPVHLLVGPLVDTDKKRADGTVIQGPAPEAVVKVSELGLIPARPGGKEWAALDPLSGKPLGFLAPERVNDGAATVASDVYGLGASLFYLLTGRAPYMANNAADVINAIENNAPAPLASLRPDLPPAYVELVLKLIAKAPAARFATAKEAADALTVFAEPPPVPLTSAPVEEPAHDFGFGARGAEETHDEKKESKASARKPVLTEAERSKYKMWLWGGIIFWVVIAPIMWIAICNAKGNKSDKNDGPVRRNK